jgi:DNA-binding NarL/FixJ family response regulator
MFVRREHVSSRSPDSEHARSAAQQAGRRVALAGRPAGPGWPEPRTPATRVLVVDDHAIVREGLKRVLEHSEAPCHVAEAASGSAALELLRCQRFDLAVLDISMPHMSGLDLLRRVRAEHPAMRVLMLSVHASDDYLLRAFRLGAHGYVAKDNSAAELAEAVRRVRAGGTYVSPELAQRMVFNLNGAGERASHTQLSDREYDVMRRLVAGRRPSEIAQALHISIKTVSTYKSRILERMQMNSTAALVRYAIDHDLDVDDIEA